MAEEYLSVQECMTMLALSRASVYGLKIDPRVEQALGRAITFLERPQLQYSRADIEALQNHLYRAQNRRVVVFLLSKGGIGRTTSVANLSHNLALQGNRVLMIDLDVQRTLSYFCMPLSTDITDDSQLPEVESYYKFSLFHVLTYECTAQQAIVQTRFNPNLYLLPAHIRMAELLLTELKDVVLKEVLAELTQFDYIMIDTAPSVSEFTMLSLRAATDVLIPLELSDGGLEGLKIMAKAVNQAKLKNRHLNIRGIFPSKVHRRRGLNDIVLTAIPDQFKPLVTKTQIFEAAEVDKANFSHQTLTEWDANSLSSRQYSELAVELFGDKT